MVSANSSCTTAPQDHGGWFSINKATHEYILLRLVYAAGTIWSCRYLMQVNLTGCCEDSFATNQQDWAMAHMTPGAAGTLYAVTKIRILKS